MHTHCAERQRDIRPVVHQNAGALRYGLSDHLDVAWSDLYEVGIPAYERSIRDLVQKH